jgi:hypothetical protein
MVGLYSSRIGYQALAVAESGLARDEIAGGAGDVRDHGGIFTGQRVEEAAFTDIGRPAEDDPRQMIDVATTSHLLGELFNVLCSICQLALQLGSGNELDIFVGEIETGFEVG